MHKVVLEMCVCTNPREYELIFFATKSRVSLSKAGIHTRIASRLGDKRHSRLHGATLGRALKSHFSTALFREGNLHLH